MKATRRTDYVMLYPTMRGHGRRVANVWVTHTLERDDLIQILAGDESFRIAAQEGKVSEWTKELVSEVARERLVEHGTGATWGQVDDMPEMEEIADRTIARLWPNWTPDWEDEADE